MGTRKKKPGKTAKRIRSSKTTTQDRTTKVLKLVLGRACFEQIKEYSDKQGWGLAESSVRRLQAKAHEIIKEREKLKHDEMLARALATSDYLISLAIEAGDIKAATKAHSDMCKMLGLYPDNRGGLRLEMTGRDGGPIQTEHVERREAVIAILNNDPNFLEYIRQQAISGDGAISVDAGSFTAANGHKHNGHAAHETNGHAVTGDVGSGNESGAMENGEPPGAHRPGTNGHRNGQAAPPDSGDSPAPWEGS